MNTWTQQQYEQFSNAIKDEPIKPAFDILFYTGIRLGELLALTPSDVLPSKCIDINKTYSESKNGGCILPPKTITSKRCVPIPDFLYSEIQEYISLHGD